MNMEDTHRDVVVSLAQLRRAKHAASGVLQSPTFDPWVAAATSLEICLGTFINSAYLEWTCPDEPQVYEENEK